jgi:hypothetical protein
MPRVPDRAMPPPHPRSSGTAGVMPRTADHHAATESIDESVDMLAIDTRGLHSAGTIDVDVDEQLFERNLGAVQPRRPAVNSATGMANASGSTDSTNAALRLADTRPQRAVVGSAMNTLNTQLVTPATGTINSSGSTDAAALMGIDDLGSTDSHGSVALTEHLRSAENSYWQPAHERARFGTKMYALMVLLAGVAVAAIFVPWKSVERQKTPHDPPLTPSCDLRPGHSPGYKPVCHGAAHNKTLCLEMNETCIWSGGSAQPPLSCKLKPGQPLAYEALCHARRTETSCLELNMTCSWRRGPHEWEQPPPRLVPRPVRPIAQTLSIHPCSFAIAKRGGGWDTHLTHARWPQPPETAFQLYRPLIFSGAVCKHVGASELEDEAGLLRELSIFLNASDGRAPEHYVLDIQAGHAWLTVSTYEGLLHGLQTFSLLVSTPNSNAVDGVFQIPACARVRDGIRV